MQSDKDMPQRPPENPIPGLIGMDKDMPTKPAEGPKPEIKEGNPH